MTFSPDGYWRGTKGTEKFQAEIIKSSAFSQEYFDKGRQSKDQYEYCCDSRGKAPVNFMHLRSQPQGKAVYEAARDSTKPSCQDSFHLPLRHQKRECFSTQDG